MLNHPARLYECHIELFQKFSNIKGLLASEQKIILYIPPCFMAVLRIEKPETMPHKHL